MHNLFYNIAINPKTFPTDPQTKARSFYRFSHSFLLHSTFLCEQNMSAKNTLRIPLLTDTSKNKAFENT